MVSMGTLFSNLLNWIIGFVFSVPLFIIQIIGSFFPDCYDLGINDFSTSVTNEMAQIIKFFWPFLQYVPWSDLWNLFSAIILYIFVRMGWNNRDSVINFMMHFWKSVVAFFIVATLLTIFSSLDWASHTAFTEVFGSSATSSISGGGMGGGGGGSW